MYHECFQHGYIRSINVDIGHGTPPISLYNNTIAVIAHVQFYSATSLRVHAQRESGLSSGIQLCRPSHNKLFHVTNTNSVCIFVSLCKKLVVKPRH